MKCEVLFHPPSHRNTQYFSFTYKNTVPFSLSHRATLVKLCVCVCVCVCARACVHCKASVLSVLVFGSICPNLCQNTILITVLL